MGKIEDCFESVEEGVLYALRAFEHPILRLTVDDLPNGDISHDVRIHAVAGIVCATELTVPPHESIPEPGLEVKPASIASVEVPLRDVKSRRALAKGASIDTRPGTTLLLRKPVLAHESAADRIREIINNAEGVVTVARTPDIAMAMHELYVLQDARPYASAMYNVAKIALSNIWQ